MAVCYRHPNRETGVSCSNCGNPICPDCMTATPVGMRCPECSRQKTPVRTMRNIYAEPTATYILIGICVLLYLGTWISGGDTSSVYIDLGTLGSASFHGNPIGVADGEYYRLVTGAFLHDPNNPLHIAFNMYILYWLGTMLEPVLGHIRFVALYFASLLAGSFGALVAAPHSLTVGASGAVFGLMAGAFVFQRARGVDPWRSGLGPVILFNLALPFLFPNLNISIGAHIGGLIGGAIAALAIEWLSPRRRGDL
ncbi:MAG TPA: rhomboid family intramembrane serine protease, partial [Solirubrobacteraceae bacterium]|nr:rhomboid family intramembrane serine protease [Solirubrobacteraceae bacterium]